MDIDCFFVKKGQNLGKNWQNNLLLEHFIATLFWKINLSVVDWIPCQKDLSWIWSWKLKLQVMKCKTRRISWEFYDWRPHWSRWLLCRSNQLWSADLTYLTHWISKCKFGLRPQSFQQKNSSKSTWSLEVTLSLAVLIGCQRRRTSLLLEQLQARRYKSGGPKWVSIQRAVTIAKRPAEESCQKRDVYELSSETSDNYSCL